MFILGVLVGRGTAPVHFDIEKLQKELSALREAVIKEEVKRYKIHIPDTQDNPEFDFHEALKKSEDDVRLSTSSNHLKTQRPEKDTRKPKQKGPAAAIKPVKPDANDNKTPIRETVESGERLTIQVASSTNVKFADKMVAQLKEKGYPAYRVSAEITGKGTWYRVRVGRFNNRSDAVQFLDNLKKENLKGIVVKE